MLNFIALKFKIFVDRHKSQQGFISFRTKNIGLCVKEHMFPFEKGTIK